MAKSVSYANTVLDSLFGSGTPATLYIGLYSAAPDADGTGGTELSGGSYARAAVTNNTTNWPNAADVTLEDWGPSANVIEGAPHLSGKVMHANPLGATDAAKRATIAMARPMAGGARRRCTSTT